MSKNTLVVKDNALINASYSLEVSEQRLILMAIVNARETGQGITSDSALEISATDYSRQFNVTNETAYITLKQAVENLFHRQFTFIERYKETNQFRKVKSRWVSRISYVEKFGILEITFAPDVVPLITRLEKHFTSYELKQISQLTSKYAVRLYEILIAWRTVKKTHLELADFREKIGLEPNEYQTMDNLKRRVLEPAISQINEHTDITASYEQHKKGRVITGFSFKFKQKPKQAQIATETPKRDQTEEHPLKPLTEPQIAKYSAILCKLGSLSDLAGTMDYPAFANWLGNILRDPKNSNQETVKRVFKALRTETDYSKKLSHD